MLKHGTTGYHCDGGETDKQDTNIVSIHMSSGDKRTGYNTPWQLSQQMYTSLIVARDITDMF